MNKLIMFPLAMIVMMAIFSSLYTPTDFTGNYTVGGTSNITINNTTTEVEIPNAGVQTFNLSGLDGALIILFAGLAVAGVAGVHILRSGLSDTSQKIIMLSVIYIGLWAVFSVLANDLLFAGEMATFGALIWIILTIMYTIGFVGDLLGSGDE